MTIASTATTQQYVRNGTTTQWSYPNKIFAAADLTVVDLDTSSPPVVTALVLGVDYTVSNVDMDTGCLVTTTSPGIAGHTLDIRSNVAEVQATSIKNQGAFLPELHEEFFDRITRELQDLRRLTYTFGIHGPDTESVAWPALPQAKSRAGTGLVFDSNGMPSLGFVPTATFTQALWDAFLSTTTNLYPRSSGEIAAGVTPSNYLYPVGHAWRYLSAGQIADAIAYTYLVDATTALQNWLNASYKSGVDAYLPGGGYLISGTIIPNFIDQVNYRGRAFRIYGNGGGPVFVIPGSAGVGTTVIRSNTNAYLLRYQQYLGAVTTSGNYYVEYIRFEQVNAAATLSVVQLDVLGEYSAFRHCEIWQAGTGDGLRLLEGTKGVVQFNNVLNSDYIINAWSGVTAYVIGNKVALNGVNYICVLGNTNQTPPNATYWAVYNRTGCGINVFSQYNAGLLRIEKNTVRGFLDGGVNGDGSHDLGPVSWFENEFSNCTRGLTNNTTMSKTTIDHNYFEGIELTNIIDKGRYTSCTRNEIQTATWTTGIDASANGGGCTYDDNVIGMPAGQSNCTGMTVASSATLMNSASKNTFVWGSSGTGLSNVIGLQITGVNGMIQHEGNRFAPNAGWAGASNCNAFLDLTTSASGSSGSGALGFGLAMDGNTSFPIMKRGAGGYWKNATNLGNAALAANVLTLGPATYVVWNPSSGTPVVNSINPAVCEDGHEYVLRIINGTGNNITLTNGANLKLGTANIVQANGTTWHYRFFMDTNVAWLMSSVQNS